ncbi:MAG: hypothetical protein PHW63_02225 [Alphaproteobacteria bacterium]|nr:hypothetical protein [Alphaproteobacteria bacterium]
MTKAGLQLMISSLKDRCKQVMDGHPILIDSSHMPCVAANLNVASRSPLAADQQTSLTALVSYVAHMTGRSEYRVERDLSDYFHIPNPKCLARDQYDAAVRFMVEQVPAGRC